jgi:Holliday junction resolvase
MPVTSRPNRIDPAAAAKGVAAERAFQAWLDSSVLPHMYVEQSRLTVPAPLRGQIKRPDYLVGIPGVGLVAFDVKAKTVYQGKILFDVAEVQKLRTFARLFHLTVYFACLDAEGSQDGFWVRLDQLDKVAVTRRRFGPVLALPISHALPVSLAEPFYAAFVRSVALAGDV